MPAPFSHFATTSDALAATTKKLQKQAILAEYLKSLDDLNLALAVRYSDARPFPITEDRTLGVSSAILIDAVLPMLPIAPQELRPLIQDIEQQLARSACRAIKSRHHDVCI